MSYTISTCRSAFVLLISFRTLSLIRLTALALLLSACEPQTVKVPNSSEHALSVTDFYGQTVTLNAPAQRIIALAPHIVENAFSAGAGNRLVGVSDYSNYPEEAVQLPVVSGFESTNFERILQLQPDLVMAWGSGNSHSAIQRLRELGFTVYIDEPKTLEDVAKSIRDIGMLSGTEDDANKVAQQYLSQLALLKAKHASKQPVSVFYQVWNSPLQTISGNHIINDAIELCGGINIFSQENAVAPIVSREAVLERNPQAIIASGIDHQRPDWLDEWEAIPEMRAVKSDALFWLDPDHIQRHTPRVLLGIKHICQQLDTLRASNAQ